jgi:hypothetical protein
VSAPFLSLGELRNLLDVVCSSNGNLQGSLSRINVIYQEVFSRFIKEKFLLRTAIANKEVEKSLANLGKCFLKIYEGLSQKKVAILVCKSSVEISNPIRLSLLMEGFDQSILDQIESSL